MIDLRGQVALVTGSSRGIGRATALRLAEAGADVIVNFLTSQTAANEVAAEIQQLGRQVVTVKADVSEPEDVASMIEFIQQRMGRLDVVVSNVASGGFRDLMDATPQHLAATMRANVQPLISLVQSASPLLSRNGQAANRAKVIALSSHGSHLALPAYGLIGASKAALESVVRHLALELGRDGINFNVVLAGLVATDSTRNMPGADGAFQAVSDRTMVDGPVLTVEDVANTVLFLASPLSDQVQGQTIVVDGGVGIRG
ncbi:MAG: SDR family oxidoreductase [Planctomycetota bacterium]